MNIKTMMKSAHELNHEERQRLGHPPTGDMEDYLVVYHDGHPKVVVSDEMAPEDVRFYRDLSWIGPAIEKAYEWGREDGYVDGRQAGVYEGGC